MPDNHQTPILSRAVPLAEPNITSLERERIMSAVAVPEIAHSPFVMNLERDVAVMFGREHGVSVSSGTAAIHLALIAAGVRQGDEVLMPTLTFVAPANAVHYVGAVPVFFDSEPEYLQIDVERLVDWCKLNLARDQENCIDRRSGRRVAAILGVDLLGHTCDVPALRLLCDELSIPLIIDAAESFGATCCAKPPGYSADFVCLSFNANKIVTGAGGGMVLCDQPEVADRVRFLSNQSKAPGRGYVHPEVGFNYRMNSPTAAMISAQLDRLPELLELKLRNARVYREGLADLEGVDLPGSADWCSSTFWLYTIHVRPETFGMTAHALSDELAGCQIESRFLFSPLHLTSSHLGREAHDCQTAEDLASTGLTLPSSTTLSMAELEFVIETIRQMHC